VDTCRARCGSPPHGGVLAGHQGPRWPHRAKTQCPPTPPWRGPSLGPPLSDRVKQLASDPVRKIEAIEVYREETGAGLAEAKEAIEAYLFDVTKKPRHIDLQLPKEEKLLGIYDFDGDTLRICTGFPGKERPAMLENTKGQTLWTLKRAKP